MAENEAIEAVYQAVLEGEVDQAQRSTKEAVAAGLDPLVVLEQGGARAIKLVGERFANFEVYLPELMLSADAMKAVMGVLLPSIKERETPQYKKGSIVIGTVSGDVHDIGKNLVSALLTANGFEVWDIGVDVPCAKFLEHAEQVKPDIIAISALMSTSSYYQEEIIKYLVDSGLREKYFVVVGGGPITPDWAREIGADGYGRTAAHAVTVCEQLMQLKQSNSRPQQTLVFY